jgi:hypothetical protein
MTTEISTIQSTEQAITESHNPSIPQPPTPKIENRKSKIKKPPKPRLTPGTLLDYIQQNPGTPLNKLTDHFRCSLEQLDKVLNDDEFLRRHKIQTQLAFLQSRIAANHCLPEALATTITLMRESQKPEVARRAAAALIQIAGLPIRTAAQLPPEPIPEPMPTEEAEMPISDDINDILHALATAPKVQHYHDLQNLEQVYTDHPYEFFQYLRDFHNEYKEDS